MKKVDPKLIEKMADNIRTEMQNVENIREQINNMIDNRLAGAIEAYNAALSEARDFIEDAVGKMEDYVEDKSENWGDSDTGTAYMDWKSEWEGMDLENLVRPDLIEFDYPHADDLENLPTEPTS